MLVLNKNDFSKLSVMDKDCPSKLYIEGNVNLLKKDSIGIIGSRKPTKETSNFIKRIIPQEFKNKVIVSGLALGSDRIAHETAIKNDIPTIAILPSGINNVYPRKHRHIANKIIEKGGAIISEYEPNDKFSKNKFIERDRIIAGLSDKLLVTQCAKFSGTMHTVNFGIKYNKKLLVHNNKSPGNQMIIKKHNPKIII